MNRKMKKLALATLAGGVVLQFGGCLQPIILGIAGGFGISIISQLLPIAVTGI